MYVYVCLYIYILYMCAKSRMYVPVCTCMYYASVFTLDVCMYKLKVFFRIYQNFSCMYVCMYVCMFNVGLRVRRIVDRSCGPWVGGRITRVGPPHPMAGNPQWLLNRQKLALAAAIDCLARHTQVGIYTHTLLCMCAHVL